MNQLATSIDGKDYLASKERRSQFLWTGGILLFFFIQAVIWTIAIIFTSTDKSHAVVAGYDQQALHWDELVAERTESVRLGWKATLIVDPIGDVRNVHSFTIELKDRDGIAVTGASIELKAFHRALAGVPQALELQEVNEGTYSGNIRIRKSGYWQFDGRATKGNSVFFLNDKQFLKESK